MSTKKKYATKLSFTLIPLLFFTITGAQEFHVHPATQDPLVLVTLDTLKEWEDELSNWGRWGPDDQRGTLNLITPEKTKQAAMLVQEGTTVTLQHFVIEEQTIDSQAFAPSNLWISRLDPVTG